MQLLSWYIPNSQLYIDLPKLAIEAAAVVILSPLRAAD
jgi:hypothetical protein